MHPFDPFQGEKNLDEKLCNVQGCHPASSRHHCLLITACKQVPTHGIHLIYYVGGWISSYVQGHGWAWNVCRDNFLHFFFKKGLQRPRVQLNPCSKREAMIVVLWGGVIPFNYSHAPAPAPPTTSPTWQLHHLKTPCPLPPAPISLSLLPLPLPCPLPLPPSGSPGPAPTPSYRTSIIPSTPALVQLGSVIWIMWKQPLLLEVTWLQRSSIENPSRKKIPNPCLWVGMNEESIHSRPHVKIPQGK